MGAYNWVLVTAVCPACGSNREIRCQTHVASSFDGDLTGRFNERTYQLGQAMAWWPHDDKRFGEWRVNGRRDAIASGSIDEEACYSTCSACGADLCVVVSFKEAVPEQVVLVAREDDWPEQYWK
jgi:hypothetical protein